MKQIPAQGTPTNPILRLLDSLPALIADQKRELLRRDLEAAGMWEHYRQKVIKPGRSIRKTYAPAQIIIKKHLGVSDDFFIDGPAEQDAQIRRIAAECHNQTLFPTPATN